MERKDYTPIKNSKQYNQSTTSQSYLKNTPEVVFKSTAQANLLRDQEALKNQFRQLEAQNRNLLSELQKIRYEKTYSQNKYMQKINFEEETIAQFQKEKNYQIQLLQIKNEEDLNRIKRDYEVQIDQLHRDIKNKDYNARQKGQQISYLELRNGELKKQLDSVERELIKNREANSLMNQNLNKQEFANKKLEMLVEELERQKCQMQTQIHVLLDIEAQKSRVVNSLEIQLRNSQTVEKSLQDKLALLTDNFSNLQEHISVMKERLLSADAHNEECGNKITHLQIILRQKDNFISEQKQRQGRLREQLQQHQGRQIRRQKEVGQLMDQNQRLYRQLNLTRHKLHDICVSEGIDL